MKKGSSGKNSEKAGRSNSVRITISRECAEELLIIVSNALYGYPNGHGKRGKKGGVGPTGLAGDDDTLGPD
jgi:hypothetical protein